MGYELVTELLPFFAQSCHISKCRKVYKFYPRTGSRYISEDVFEEVPTLLGKIGTALPTPLNRHSVDNGKVTDHHAIIPTGETTSGLSTDETTIYQMVVHRFIEAFSPDSEEERMQAELTDGTNTYIWKACRSISLGWKAVQHSTGTNDEKGKEEEEQTLSVLPNLICREQKGDGRMWHRYTCHPS